MQTVATGRVFPNCPSQTQLARKLNQAIAKAGIQPWPKPFMNLRSSCETYLIRQGFDLTTVTTWLGNSPKIAQKHYLQVTPGDISKAANFGNQEFSNSFQHEGDSRSTVSEKPVFSSMPEHGKAFQYTRQDSKDLGISRQKHTVSLEQSANSPQLCDDVRQILDLFEKLDVRQQKAVVERIHRAMEASKIHFRE